MKSRIVVFFFGIAALLTTLHQGIWLKQKVIHYDGTGYYMYLPALIIHNDLDQLTFYENIDNVYHPSDGVYQYGIHSHPITGRRSIRYPVGVAFFELPGFLAADYFTRYSAITPGMVIAHPTNWQYLSVPLAGRSSDYYC